MYDRIVNGREPAYRGWLTPTYEAQRVPVA
jgi:hypothetical protein